MALHQIQRSTAFSLVLIATLMPLARDAGARTDAATGGTIILSVPGTAGGSRLNEVGARDGHRRVLLRSKDRAARDEDPAWSERGRLLAFVRFSQGRVALIVSDAEGNIERRIPLGRVSARGSGSVSDPQWSPDGRKIVLEQSLVAATSLVAPKSQIVLVDLKRGTTRVLALGSSPTFLGNSRVAFLRVRWHIVAEMGGAQVLRPARGQLLLIATAGGTPRLLHSIDDGEYISALGSPDGRRVAVVVGDDQGSPDGVLSADHLGRVQWINKDFGGPSVIAWSPAGRRLAMVEGEELVVAGGSRQHRFPRPFTGFRLQIGALAWSPDGRLLAALSCPGFASARCELARLRVGETRWQKLTRLYALPSGLAWRR